MAGARPPKYLYTAVADALQWVMFTKEVSGVDHYLDNFITMGPAGSDKCEANLARILAVCDETGGAVCP